MTLNTHTRRAAPGDNTVPVAYVLVPPAATAKSLAAEFAATSAPPSPPA